MCSSVLTCYGGVKKKKKRKDEINVNLFLNGLHGGKHQYYRRVL